jgi:hypothetical protein
MDLRVGRLALVAGVPGSGKRARARSVFPGHVVVSVDACRYHADSGWTRKPSALFAEHVLRTIDLALRGAHGGGECGVEGAFPVVLLTTGYDPVDSVDAIGYRLIESLIDAGCIVQAAFTDTPPLHAAIGNLVDGCCRRYAGEASDGRIVNAETTRSRARLVTKTAEHYALYSHFRGELKTFCQTREVQIL